MAAYSEPAYASRSGSISRSSPFTETSYSLLTGDGGFLVVSQMVHHALERVWGHVLPSQPVVSLFAVLVQA